MEIEGTHIRHHHGESDDAARADTQRGEDFVERSARYAEQVSADAIGGEADMPRAAGVCRSNATDPTVWTDRALQAEMMIWR
jgi:hypothetical protein